MISMLRTCTWKTACSRCKSYESIQVFREARMLDKMMKRVVAKKSVEASTPRKLKKEFLTSAYENEGSNRKIAALNKIYMEQIVETINIGECSKELNELGIEISKIKLSPCRSSLNIYWICKKEGISETEIAEVLEKARKEMQEQVGLLRAMRKIPFVNFVKDLKLETMYHVEKLFEIADLGEGFTAEAKRQDKPNPDSEYEVEIKENKEMRQNVLGLDHAKMTERIKQDIRRFQAVNINRNEVEEIKYEYPEKLVKFDKKLFASFYKRKLYLDGKLRKREYRENYMEDLEPYDPEKAADEYWQSKVQNNFMKIEKEIQGYENDYENDYNVNYCDEYTEDYEEPDNDDKEIEKEEKSGAEKNQ